MNLHDLFAIALRRSPDKPALEVDPLAPLPGPDSEDRRSALSYAELFGAADRLAAGLRGRGVRHGDRVAFFVGNGPGFVIAYLAVIRIGAVMVPMNLAYRRREIVHILSDAEPRLLITERERLAVLDELEPQERPGDVLLVEDLDAVSGDPSALDGLVDNDDLAMILYTSGTTGRSKGAMITHGNVLATMTGLLTAWAWEPADVLLLTLPLFHTHGLVVGLHCALAAGATVKLRRRFDAAETAAELLEDAPGSPTLFFGVPTMYVRLIDELRRRGGGETLSRLRLFCSGSAPLSPEAFSGFRELTGHEILERYGMTETGMSLSNLYAGRRLPGTVGVPLPGVSARIVSPDDRDVPEGGEGELLVRGSHVFPGYWRDPEKTAASFLEDDLGRRWFRTGDLARRDPGTGHISLLGRRHELILRGGFNIYPREVEEVLVTFPGVREAAVVGRPHPELGEIPVAFLVVDPLATEGPLDEAALLTFCRSQMAAFKIPGAIRIVDSLPRNALGKVQKHLLPE